VLRSLPRRETKVERVVDFGPSSTFDLERSIEEGLTKTVDPAAYGLFKERLNAVEWVLYLGDNAGEIVLDKLLIEELVRQGKRVSFVVRSEPILNDVTVEDASYVGLHALAAVMESGAEGPGTTLSHCSERFRATFLSAPLILSKGQGNFEGLSEVRAPLFFLFKVKCPVVAREVQATLGEVVFKPQEDKGWSGKT